MPFTVPMSELTYRASRASGPGGQHVNKSATRVEVIWDVGASPSLTESERARLFRKLATRIDARGCLAVAADERRSQLLNRDAATARLNALVAKALEMPKPRKKTRPTKASREKRLQEKKRRAEVKRSRGPVRGDD
jgi:ribosome-associated protein